MLYDFSLKPFNTFGLDQTAGQFAEITNTTDIAQYYKSLESNDRLILGGGSNILLTRDIEGPVLKNNLKGIEIISETADYVFVKAASGENWHSFVLYCIENNFAGVENLSLIPGTIGAAPMQNIGAYGVEIKDVFVGLEALNLQTFEMETFDKEACHFGYRESVFKRALKGKYFICSVTFRLNKKADFNIEYGDIKQELFDKGFNENNLTIKAVSDAVILIRKSKLPDPAVLGNSGSFFKNPVISEAHFNDLKSKYPEIKGYMLDGGVKIAAGWLIESLGWKGKRVGNTGSHVKQALVLVNYGGAKGNEVKELAFEIIASVKAYYNIDLEPEVNII